VFPLLTKYLLQYKKVSIPNIGMFTIEHQPAELNFADRLILPPGYKVVFANHESVDDDLLSYIGTNSQMDESTARQKLEHFGTALKNKLREAPFEWNGIGKLEYTNGVVFHPNKIETALQPVPANRIIRENTQHTVLVGEQELQSTAIEQSRLERVEVKRKISVPLLIGVVLLALALAFLGYHFYTHQNIKSSTGLKTEIKQTSPASTYK
jgi:hypothetical protein